MKAQTSGTVVPDISVVNTAKTKLALAKQLEQLIDDTVGATNPDLLQSLRDARVKKAQIHAWDSVRNPSTGQFDVAGLAKRRLYDDMMTGTVGTVADYTNLFPKSMGVSPLEKHGRVMDHARRLSVGGAAGSLVGLTLGYPGIGALTGVLVGEGAGALNAMRMMTPAVQNANAMAAAARLSNRSMVGMNPVTPNATPNGIVPYDYSQLVSDTPPPSSPPPSGPNWRTWRPAEPSPVKTGPQPMGAPRLAAPSAEGTLKAVADRNMFDSRMSAAIEAQKTLDAQNAALAKRGVYESMDNQRANMARQKAMDEAIAFDEIARRAGSTRAELESARQAGIARDALMDKVDAMTEQLSRERPDNSRKMPGKKTLNHMRNSETRNQLTELKNRP